MTAKFLDSVYGNGKRNRLLALAGAALVYVLALFFGDERALWYRPLIMGVTACGVIFLVMFVQVKNPNCSKKALNIELLFFTVAICFTALLTVWYWFGNDPLGAATVAAEGAGMYIGLSFVYDMQK